MKNVYHFLTLKGSKINRWIPQLAQLRIEVFREYPFLYEGDLEYEKKYLKKYLSSPETIAALAFQGEKMIGAATGTPLSNEIDSIKEPFIQHQLHLDDYYCLGEMILKKEYRGKKIGGKMFVMRERAILHLNHYSKICFYTSTRSLNDPRKPDDYRPLNEFWKQRGFKKHPQLTTSIPYREIGETEESPKEMEFWIKEI